MEMISGPARPDTGRCSLRIEGAVMLGLGACVIALLVLVLGLSSTGIEQRFDWASSGWNAKKNHHHQGRSPPVEPTHFVG